ncbi:MAG: GlsB/YeaQ/YmgE family stress response membrane protein [Deltaproteobacteria bacterium]
MGLLVFLIFGLFVGFLARALLPGRQSMGIIMTSALGMVGSLLGGFLGSLISHEEVTRVHSAGLIGSVLGALLVLALVSMGSRRRSIL